MSAVFDATAKVETIEELVVVALYDIWPNPSEWTRGWPGAALRRLGGSIDKSLSGMIQADYDRIEEVERRRDDYEELMRNEYEDEVKRRRATWVSDLDLGIYDEDREEREFDPAQRRREARHGADISKVEQRFRELTLHVLPSLDLSNIGRHFAPWDVEEWNAGAWFRRGAL